MKKKCEETATCFVCNVDVSPKSRVYFKRMAEEPMESIREILAEKYSDEQIVEVLGKEPIVCRGKCNTILKKLMKLMTLMSEKQLLLIVLSMKLSSSLTFTIT